MFSFIVFHRKSSKMGNRKRRTRALDSPDADSIKKRLRANRCNTGLLDLNDDCLLAIFEKLNGIELCHMQNVCKRFGSLTEGTFRSLLKQNPEWASSDIGGPECDTRRIFYKFGHLFATFHVHSDIDYDVLQRLTELTILNVVSGRITTSSSKRLRVKRSPLQRLTFSDKLPPLSIFKKMLQSSQQLQCLGLPLSVSDKYIPHIQKLARQLTELDFHTPVNSVGPELPTLLRYLKNLRKLIITGSMTRSINSAKPILESIKHNIPGLIHIELKEFMLRKQYLQIVSQMESLQHITMMGIFDCLKSEIVSMVAALPSLITLTLAFENCCSPNCRSRNVDFGIVKDIVEAGKKLNSLKFVDAIEMRIDGDGYAKLLDILKGNNRTERLTIAIEGCRKTTTFDVPMEVQKANDECLRIDYDVEGRCRCSLSS